MSTNQCLNSSQSHFNKFISDDRGDKTRSTQNLSKLCENCRLIKDELEAEIFTLKDKSHQSFMQVIQVQQLHEQEMQLMKMQHQEQITVLRQEISKLLKQITRHRQQLLAMQKNSKHHIYYMEQPSFLIDNIEIIQCHEDCQRKSRLDQSSYEQFNQILQPKNSDLAEHFFLKPKPSQSQKQLSFNLESQQNISRLNLRILELQSEVQTLWETNQQLKKQCTKLQTNEKSIKNNYDSLYKQSKFMADHIRTLANDKFKLQRKVKELQKDYKELINKGLKKSSFINDDRQSQMSIKINGSDIFTSQDLDNVRNSFQNSRDQKETNFLHKNCNISPTSEVPQTVGINDFNKPKSTQTIMTRSEMFNNNNDLQARKSMPNYKKVSHISPSFKKLSVKKGPEKQKYSNMLLRIESQEVRENDKSDFMDQIRKQIQLKASLKKSVGPSGSGQKISLFHETFRKRSSAQ